MNIINESTLPDGRQKLSVMGAWSEETENLLKNKKFEALSLQTPNEDNYKFLEKYANQLTELMIFSGKSFLGLERLTNLNKLYLDRAPNPPLDISVFKKLESSDIVWNKRYSKVFFELPKLRELKLEGYTEKTCDDIGAARILEYLRLVRGSLKSTQGLERIQTLKKLELFYLRSLSDVTSLSELTGLERLDITNCSKVEDIDQVVGKMTGLKHLSLENTGGHFLDLTWLRGLTQLRYCFIDPIVDEIGWKHVFEVPKLDFFRVKTLPGYKITNEELQAIASPYNKRIKEVVRATEKGHPQFSVSIDRPDGSIDNEFLF